MEGKMKVAVMEGVGKMGFTERPIPTPKDDEVLVKLEYVGISKLVTELRLSRAKHVDIVNSVKLEDTISVRMLFSLQHRLLMVCSRSM